MIKLKDTYLGFTDNVKPLQRTKIENCLDKLIRYQNNIYSYKEYMLMHLQEGHTLSIEENCRHWSKRLDDYTKPKTEYRINHVKGGHEVYNDIDRTLYNFGLYLQENDLISDENISTYLASETARIEAEKKAIEDKELKEKQEKELQEQQKEEFKNWLNLEAEKYNNIEKIALSKKIFLGELNQYNELHVNALLVMIDNINNPLCRQELQKRLWNGNTTSKKVFGHITGVKLPSTDKGTMEILENITPGDYTGMLMYKKRKEAGEVPQEIFYKLITIPKVKFEECYGIPVKKFGFDMFLCKENKGYTLRDIKSGCQLTSGATKAEVFDKLKSSIEKNSFEKINSFINQFIEKYGVSPRYKAA